MQKYRRDLTARAQKLRREMTEEERHLWYDFLCDYPVSFRRQKPIGSYILDFYCTRAKLAVELDGSQHYEEHGRDYDIARDAKLREADIQVLRISNRDLWEAFPAVCAYINQTVQERLISRL